MSKEVIGLPEAIDSSKGVQKMTMEYINKGLVARATATAAVVRNEEIRTVKGALTYLFKIVFGGEHPEIMLLFAGIIIILSYKNYYGAKSTGQPLGNHGEAFFIILSSVAAVFHAADLYLAWLGGSMVLLQKSNDPVANFWFAVLWGVASGAIILLFSIIIRKIKVEQIQRKAFYQNLHRLGRKK